MSLSILREGTITRLDTVDSNKIRVETTLKQGGYAIVDCEKSHFLVLEAKVTVNIIIEGE